MSIEKIGNELINCKMNCEGIVNDSKKGIIPRAMLLEYRKGLKKAIIVGLNPGKCSDNERQFYLDNGISFNSVQRFFQESGLKDGKRYFGNTRDFITELGYDGDILWTDLAKCECSGNNGELPIQTLRVCINKYLKNEINEFKADVIFALGNVAFDFCALSFPEHQVIGIPHPSGSFGDFQHLKKSLVLNKKIYLDAISNKKDKFENTKAIKLIDVMKKAPKTEANH